MRISVSQKVFLAFLVLFTITLVIAVSLWVGIADIRRSGDEVKTFKDFHLSVRGLELFNWGPESRLPADRLHRFANQFQDLQHEVVRLKTLRADLTPSIRKDLETLDEQLVYYRNAFLELLQRQETDERLHQEQHRLMEELSRNVGDENNPAIRRIFAEILALWGRAYHDRDVEAIARLRELTLQARGDALNEKTKALLAQADRAVEASYLNFLGILERETFLAGTGRRFVNISNRAVDAIAAFETDRQNRLTLLIGGAILASLALTCLFWVLATRHTRRFLGDSLKMMHSIRAGEFDLPEASCADDEFGDQIRFIRQMGASLKESVLRHRASEEMYRRLVEDISDWVWETDARRVCVYSSPVVRRVLGRDPEAVTGAPLADLLDGSGSGTKSPEVRRAIESDSRKEGVVSFTLRADGSSAVLESSWKPFLDKEGAFLGLRGVTRDVTERHQAEEERERLEGQLVHSQKMEAIGTLSGGVAHDFNNLLQSIGGYADLLLHRGALSDKDRGAVEKILETTAHAGRLTQQLLLYSRRAETLFSDVDLNAEVRRVSELLERTIPKMVRIETRLADDVPPILADPVQMEQILMNLGINARDAMPEGGVITFRTASVPAGKVPGGNASGGRYAALMVSDTGTGMSPEVRERIFEPFFTTKDIGKGTGLGLSIVYGIVKTHNALIDCQSRVGEGTTFTLYFPESAREQPLPAAETHAASSPRDAHPSATILLVDDEASIRETTDEALRLNGYDTLLASSGEAALDIFGARKNEVDLVLLDLNMPGMGGAECCRRMLELNPDARIVITTGFSEEEAGQPDLREKAIGYLKKPYRIQVLLDTIRNVIAS